MSQQTQFIAFVCALTLLGTAWGYVLAEVCIGTQLLIEKATVVTTTIFDALGGML